MAREGVSLLNRLLPRVNLLLVETLADRCEELREQVEESQEAARFLHQFGQKLAKLEPMISVLQSDPEQHQQLQDDYRTAQQQQRDYRQQAFALTEVVQRRAHFNYSEAEGMVDGNSDLTRKLRQRLAQKGPRAGPSRLLSDV